VWDLGSAIGEPEPATRAINMNLLGEELIGRANPPIDVLFVYDANPVASTPNQERVRAGLSRGDLFTVVFDQVMTDTARYADVLLPATTFLEHEDLARGYGAMILQEVRPVTARVGESRPNYEVFSELCRRMGLSRPGDAETAAEVAETMISASPRAAAIRASLAERGVAFPPAGPRPLAFVDFQPPTPTGKADLVPADMDAETPDGLYHFRPDPGTEEFPLALISPATSRTISSTFGQLHRKLVPVEIHPDDAAARGIRDGDTVRVFNRFGEVRCPARLSDDLRRGVALLSKGLWSHNTLSGTTATALAPDSLTDLGGGACFNDARVQIERAT
jgi:anaerobic selenocysteine-containing dehydrogenase